MTVRDLAVADVRRLGTATVSKNSSGATNMTGDVNLSTNANFKHGDKILVVFSASTAGTTNTIAFGVLDAPDNAGSIGSTAAATTDGTLTGGTGNQYAHTFVQLKAGRPWLRFQVTGNGTTDTFVCTAHVFAVGPMA